MKPVALLMFFVLPMLSEGTLAGEQPALEQRVERLERILRNQSLSDIVLRLQRLQQELRQLRGEVELQAHNVDALTRRQRDLYLDIDRRLSGRQPSPPPPAVGPVPAVPGAGTAARVEKPGIAASPGAAPAGETPRPHPGGGDPKREQAAYQQAFELLKQRRYQEAIQAFGDFLDLYPAGEYADNAQYWLGEANYVTRNFDVALGEFARVLSDYPDSAKVPGAMLKIGYIQYERKDWVKARKTLERLVQRFPGKTEARLARKRLERMQREGH